MRSLHLFLHDLQQFWSRPRRKKSLTLSHIPFGYNSRITFLSYVRKGTVDNAAREKAALTSQQGRDVFTSDKIKTELQLLSSQEDCGLRNCQVVWCTFMASWQHTLQCYSLSQQNHRPLSIHNTKHYRKGRFRFSPRFIYKFSLPGCNATSMGVPRRFEPTEERNILYTTKRRKTNWIGHILRRNFLLKHVTEGRIEGSIEVTGGWGRISDQLLDDLKEKRRFWILKEEALDRTQWRTRFGRGYGPVVRKTTEWMNEWMNEWIMQCLHL